MQHRGDHDVADNSSQGRSLAHGVNAEHIANAGGNIGQYLIGRHAKRIINVDSQGVAFQKALQVLPKQASIDPLQIQ